MFDSIIMVNIYSIIVGTTDSGITGESQLDEYQRCLVKAYLDFVHSGKETQTPPATGTRIHVTHGLLGKASQNPGASWKWVVKNQV